LRRLVAFPKNDLTFEKRTAKAKDIRTAVVASTQIRRRNEIISQKRERLFHSSSPLRGRGLSNACGPNNQLSHSHLCLQRLRHLQMLYNRVLAGITREVGRRIHSNDNSVSVGPATTRRPFSGSRGRGSGRGRARFPGNWALLHHNMTLMTERCGKPGDAQRPTSKETVKSSTELKAHHNWIKDLDNLEANLKTLLIT